MIINYAAREIHLNPNKSFDDVFDYAYTGVGIYFVNGTILVEDVIPGSPAAKAGFEVGDQIMGVNNNLSNNIQSYKDILQTPNVSIPILVKRKGVIKLLLLHTISIR
jgi:C-terminal processing protease CtpA/Prc